MRYVQHKREAYWFYRFLSIFYDDYVNPFFWTERMRDETLALADWSRRDLKTIDVGSGTGFTTTGIVQHVAAENVTCVDQSPHQMAKAQAKPQLRACTFRLGDAEDIPFPTDSFDRYVSAGSIEYWPEPERGVAEAYRVIKPGGQALLIGPLRPKNPIARWVADTWMLFPEVAAYEKWYRDAGFTDIRTTFSRPSWVGTELYGIAIVGTKPAAGLSPMPLPPRKKETTDEVLSLGRSVKAVGRVLVGSTVGGLFIPMALVGYANQLWRKATGQPSNQLEPLTPAQRNVLLAIGAGLVWKIFGRKKR
jgi:MPBQ/MSBQ methyltransferase